MDNDDRIRLGKIKRRLLLDAGINEIKLYYISDRQLSDIMTLKEILNLKEKLNGT